MRITRLWLQDFRSYESLELPLDVGLTAIVGANGIGKTNLLEAIGLPRATLQVVPRVPTIRRAWSASGPIAAYHAGRIGVEQGIGSVQIECSRSPERDAVESPGQPATSAIAAADLAAAAQRMTVFAPDDLATDQGWTRQDSVGTFVDDVGRRPCGPARTTQVLHDLDRRC